MRQFLHRLFRDYVQGGSLFERLGKQLGWSEGKPSEMLSLRQQILLLDPENLRLEKELRTSGFAQNYPVVKSLFPSKQVYHHQSRYCQLYLHAQSYAQDRQSRDVIELLVGLPKVLDPNVEIEWQGTEDKLPSSPQSGRVPTKSRNPNSPQLEQLLRGSEAERETLRKLYLYPFLSLTCKAQGLRLHFDDRLNLGQSQNLIETAIELADFIEETRQSRASKPV